MAGYYADKLSGKRLKQVYESAPPRIKQYLDAEVEYLLSRIKPEDSVLELGCGYGRILPRLAEKAAVVVGIDNSMKNLQYEYKALRGLKNCSLACMDASQLAFRDRSFDMVVCIQNGISAFQAGRRELIREAMSVTKSGGRALFSSYSEKFWDDRLEWFKAQADDGLIGEIDFERTGDGVIVCKDGFTASTVSPEEFLVLTENLGADVSIVEVDESSIFCEITRH